MRRLLTTWKPNEKILNKTLQNTTHSACDPLMDFFHLYSVPFVARPLPVGRAQSHQALLHKY
jgi:hypothetical protein